MESIASSIATRCEATRPALVSRDTWRRWARMLVTGRGVLLRAYWSVSTTGRHRAKKRSADWTTRTYWQRSLWL